MRRGLSGVGVHALGAVMLSAASVATVSTAGPALSQLRGPGTLNASRPIPTFIADGDRDTGFRPEDRQLARWAFDAWERSAGGRIDFEPSSVETAAIVRLYWAGPNDGQYGEMRPLIVGERIGAAVFVRPDTNALGEDIALLAARDPLLRATIVYLTSLHEIGHALGLRHTDRFEDVMYFFGYGGDVAEFFGNYRKQIRSRDDIPTVSGLSAGDLDQLASLYPAE